MRASVRVHKHTCKYAYSQAYRDIMSIHSLTHTHACVKELPIQKIFQTAVFDDGSSQPHRALNRLFGRQL